MSGGAVSRLWTGTVGNNNNDNNYREVLMRCSIFLHNLLDSSRIKKDSSLRTDSIWQVDTHMVLPQTKCGVIHAERSTEVCTWGRFHKELGLVLSQVRTSNSS